MLKSDDTLGSNERQMRDKIKENFPELAEVDFKREAPSVEKIMIVPRNGTFSPLKLRNKAVSRCASREKYCSSRQNAFD